MAHDKWRERATSFDNWYSDDSFETRVPYIGKQIRDAMLERLNRALVFSAPREGRTILDLGCGTGRFAVEAAARGAVVHAYDISPEAIAVAKGNAQAAGIEDRCFFYEADITEIGFPNADVWMDLGCLQYIKNIGPILQRLKHVKDFFSALPRREHWTHPIRVVYRTYLKGNPYYTYSDEEIGELFNVYEHVFIEDVEAVKYVTSAEFEFSRA